MISQQNLETTIHSLISSNVDFIVYGHKSWGGTSLVKEALTKIYQKEYFMYLNSVLVFNRSSFFRIFTEQFLRVVKLLSLKAFDSELEKQMNVDPDWSVQNLTMQQWLKKMNQFIGELGDVIDKIERMYVIVDHFQELCFSTNFMSMFYKVSKFYLKNFKFSFVFCGSNFKQREMSLLDPYRRLMSLFVQRPQTIKPIQAGISQVTFHLQSKNLQEKVKQKIISHLKQKLDMIEVDHKVIKQISKQLTSSVTQHLFSSPTGQSKLFQQYVRKEQMNQLTSKLIQFGPVCLKNFDLGVVEKDEGKKLKQYEGERDLFDNELEKYPNLLMCSVFLANGYPETEDRRRFCEYNRKKLTKLKSNIHHHNNFKKNPSILRHNTQRIIAISQSLEDSAPKPINTDQMHHNLDFYGCFEYLRDLGEIDYYGKTSHKFWGKIKGEVKQDSVRDFLLHHMNHRISQFTDLEDIK